MRNVLTATCCGVALLGSVSLAFAGTYGEPEQPEEAPSPVQVAPETEPEGGWTFFITPQIWGSRIESNGFASASAIGGKYIDDGAGNVLDAEPFTAQSAQAVDDLDVQWGVQLVAAKNRWAFAASFQTVDYETRSNVDLDTPFAPVAGISNGRVAQEYLNNTRYDFDLATSYMFPNVIEKRLDMSLGLGLKAIYASAVRHYDNVNPILNTIFPDGLYPTDCDASGCMDTASRVKTDSWTYGVVIPFVTNWRLTDSGDWRLPVSVTPLIGATTRDDHGAVFKFNYDPSTNAFTQDRGDGTSFAWGGTVDATLRHRLADNVWFFAGMRVQYIDMDSSDDYFAWGPLAGITASFSMNDAKQEG